MAKKTGPKVSLKSQHVTYAFDRGQIPVIAMVNRSSYPADKFSKLIAALQEYSDLHLGPVWGVKCTLLETPSIEATQWAIVFQDEPDIKDAYGYHHLTPKGMPMSKVFVKLAEKGPGGVSCTASHELAEMLLDPGVQMCAMAPNGVIYAYEIADPPEAFYFNVRDFPMSDFVYPSWFEGFRKPRSTQFDHMSLIDRPFKILKGGYMSIFKNGRWSQIFSSKVTQRQFDIKEHGRAVARAQTVEKD
jgi:hypothetical protein